MHRTQIGFEFHMERKIQYSVSSIECYEAEALRLLRGCDTIARP
jgi:hypothetical protein